MERGMKKVSKRDGRDSRPVGHTGWPPCAMTFAMRFGGVLSCVLLWVLLWVLL